MKHALSFVSALFILVGSAYAQNSFFAGKKNTSSPMNIGFSHMIYHFEGANRGWALWFDYGNFEIGVGSDLGNYPSTVTEDWTTSHNADEPYTHYQTEKHMSGASATVYYGWFFNDYLATGIMLDLYYGARETHIKTYNYGYGIGSTTTIYEGDPEHIFSAGIYIKGNYQIKDRFNLFLMWQGGLDGNSGFSFGFLFNI
ncbi:MAG: hypothetical protein J5605_01370 [Bacteroidales bacterium]|nr:hypothetical protein [Bacteroidales bacterium]